MNTSIINLDQLVSMTSVEIAELTGKEHKHVLRDIRNMVNERNGSKTGLVGEEVYKDTFTDSRGKTQPFYRLDRKHTFILVAGYSVHLRAKYYDYIQMLEQKVLQLEDQKKRAAIQSANRRGVTWGDYCTTHGLPAQKLMTILKKERTLFRVNPISGEWSVNPTFAEDSLSAIHAMTIEAAKDNTAGVLKAAANFRERHRERLQFRPGASENEDRSVALKRLGRRGL